MADVFISYSQKDRVQAKALADQLTTQGLKVWWDTELIGGQAFRDEILTRLEAAKAVVVLWSPNSSASRFVLDEADTAAATGKLVSVMLDDFPSAKLPLGFRSFHAIAFDDTLAIRRSIERCAHSASDPYSDVINEREQQAAKFLKSKKSLIDPQYRRLLAKFLREFPNSEFGRNTLNVYRFAMLVFSSLMVAALLFVAVISAVRPPLDSPFFGNFAMFLSPVCLVCGYLVARRFVAAPLRRESSTLPD